MLTHKILLRRLRFWWNISGAYIFRYKLRILIILLILVLSGIITKQIWPKISQKNLVTIGYVGNYTLENIPTQILSLATQSLISVDENGRPEASLAANWTVSEDGKTYVVFLKDNLFWHDESPVNAKDISIAINGVQITAINNKAIEFRLPNPIISFPLALDKPVFKTSSFYGTGKFRIVDIDLKDNIVKKISLISKDKNLPKVNIKFYQSEEQALDALIIGEVKSARVANANYLERWSNLNVNRIVDESEIVTIFLNTQDPQVSSKDFRQALSYSINRSDFEGLPSSGPISPASWAFNPSVKLYEYNTGKAKNSLSKAEIASPQINLSVTSGLEKVADTIKKDWEAIGVSVNISVEKTMPQKYQAFLALNKLSPDPDQYALWHSTQDKTNITHFKNVKIDKLLEDARSVVDEQKRKELYGDFQKFLVEESPAIFLYHPYKYQVTYKNIADLIDKLPQ
ncbi:hypothetical protein A2165_00080 [Candidatus Curtissbacteria bacterium RBG_13_40_7]|uniref:Solute-binding protein family 5 domain-containing protein n=1 Tax=Candidatus Curtissbacteria bacterium RBG_13_40_7 TaxID=1797706 RepID=A0A1F5FXH9_9BACT|nr:MAG: hypothetical protein A2165_00080 [Candidatus Curtissbacteria bacterium RBG_13_40_7]